MSEILFHGTDQRSPFAEALSKIAAEQEISIASPYLRLEVLRGLVDVAESWELITDLREWMGSIQAAEMQETVDFLQAHLYAVRDVAGLHAKLVLGPDTAYLGSANLTRSGLTRNHELGVVLDDADELVALREWYEGLWKGGKKRTHEEIEHLARAFSHDSAPDREERRKQAANWDVEDISRPQASLAPLRVEADSSASTSPMVQVDDRAWKRLVERLQLAPGRWWAERFFDLFARLLDATGLVCDDRRLAATIPTTTDLLPVSINDRYVLSGMWKTNRDLGFMVGPDFLLPDELADHCVHRGDGYEPNSHESEETVPKFTALDVFPDTTLPEELLEQWLHYSTKEASYRSGSMHRQYHQPILCEVARDTEMRARLFDEAFRPVTTHS